MTNIYILSKSYHEFFLFFCSLFIGGQKKCNIKMWSPCKHTHTHTRKQTRVLNTHEMPYFVSYSCIKCWRCMCFLSFADDVIVLEINVFEMMRRRREEQFLKVRKGSGDAPE